jgi:NAD(P)H-hydrate epimerase
VAAVRRLAERGVALLKGPYTLVACESGLFINPTGHPVLATGGSGDVLAGFVGGLLARGLQGVDAARVGAWRHGRAGESLAEQRVEGWSASDLPEALRSGWATSPGR